MSFLSPYLYCGVWDFICVSCCYWEDRLEYFIHNIFEFASKLNRCEPGVVSVILFSSFTISWGSCQLMYLISPSWYVMIFSF